MAESAVPLTALADAIRADDVAAAAQLLAEDNGLKAHLDDEMPGGHFGATALLTAVQRGNRGMVDALLDAGADINVRSHWWAGSFGVLDHDGPLTDHLIARGASVDVHAAARLGRVGTLTTLLAADPALVRARGGDGQTPLHFARSIPVAEYLLAHGAEIDARDVDHESTPAQWMIRDRTEVARYLVAQGCATDLLLAAALGDRAVMVEHLDSDPSLIRTTVSEDYFPKRDPRSGGTIYNWTLGTGKCAHIIAREFGHADAFALLMERSPDELRLLVWCMLGESAQVSSLLASTPQLSQRLTAADRRALPDAARDGRRRAVTLMLKAGWPVDARGQHGATALHWGAWNGEAELTSELLRHGPSLELTDSDYHGTALFWALYGSVHGARCRTGDYPGVVEVLLNAGAIPPPLTAALQASDGVREKLQRLTGGSH
jgi:ankyrin repeat protein